LVYNFHFVISVYVVMVKFTQELKKFLQQQS